MARKQSITKEVIQEAALSLARQEGLEAVTARRVAAQANCSTQPIFRAYENMADLQDDVIRLAGEFFADYYEKAPKDSAIPFVDLGITYIRFATEHENLFRILFVSHYKKHASTYEFINGGEKMYVLKELKKVEGVPAQKAGMIFSSIWTFVNGMACMSLNGDLDMDETEIREELGRIYEALRKA
ncbi:MAG: TetR/AcrR family transcriptional regulator [Lachnospiraceae bacterium]|nr:TetR/AcrR family transcriptional regulator [Lachnospiraceae bacterium]